MADCIWAGFCADEALVISQWQDESGQKLLCDVKHFSLHSNADGTREQKAMELEEKVWEILLSADKKDYERICAEYGITDFRGMLKKLCEMKKEREEEIAGVCKTSFLLHFFVYHYSRQILNYFRTIFKSIDLFCSLSPKSLHSNILMSKKTVVRQLNWTWTWKIPVAKFSCTR